MTYKTLVLALAGAGMIALPAARAEEKPSPVLTGLATTVLSGYVDTSAQWNLGTGNANVPTYSYGGEQKADGFNLNVVDLALEKAVDPKADWGAGYKVELWLGPDANALATTSTGIGNANSDFALKQGYVALHAPVGNGLDFKIGVWDPLIGYEVSDSPGNPNFTRSYGYTIEPVSHTGIQSTYVFGEALSASAGVADTFGPTINQRAFYKRAESYKTYMGLVTLTAPKSWGFLAGSTLSGCVINGFNQGANTGNGADQTSWYVGTTLNTPLTWLKVGASYDYAGVSHQSVSGSSYANATAVYAAFQITDKLSFNARGEYASSDALVSLTGPTGAPVLEPLLGSTKVFAATGTVQYDLWKNVLSRVEFRWDHSADGAPAYGGTTVGDPTKKNNYILLANIVYKF
jgi:Putative beta-barrel porin-2, OmpL-like. bbp2